MKGLTVWDVFGVIGVENGFKNGVLRAKTQKCEKRVFTVLHRMHDCSPPGTYCA